MYIKRNINIISPYITNNSLLIFEEFLLFTVGVSFGDVDEDEDEDVGVGFSFSLLSTGATKPTCFLTELTFRIIFSQSKI